MQRCRSPPYNRAAITHFQSFNLSFGTKMVETIYCVCRKKEKGHMIQCDGCVEWFHYSCVGVKKSQKLAEKWLCPMCNSRQKGHDDLLAKVFLIEKRLDTKVQRLERRLEEFVGVSAMGKGKCRSLLEKEDTQEEVISSREVQNRDRLEELLKSEIEITKTLQNKCAQVMKEKNLMQEEILSLREVHSKDINRLEEFLMSEKEKTETLQNKCVQLVRSYFQKREEMQEEVISLREVHNKDVERLEELLMNEKEKTETLENKCLQLLEEKEEMQKKITSLSEQLKKPRKSLSLKRKFVSQQ